MSSGSSKGPQSQQCQIYEPSRLPETSSFPYSGWCFRYIMSVTPLRPWLPCIFIQNQLRRWKRILLLELPPLNQSIDPSAALHTQIGHSREISWYQKNVMIPTKYHSVQREPVQRNWSGPPPFSIRFFTCIWRERRCIRPKLTAA